MGLNQLQIPIGSMYGIFTYIWLKTIGKCREIYNPWILWELKPKNNLAQVEKGALTGVSLGIS